MAYALESAIPLAVAEAERWRYDLSRVRMGQVLLEQAAQIEMPTNQDVLVKPWDDIKHRTVQIIDHMSKGFTAPQTGRTFDISEWTVYKHLREAREAFEVHTDEHLVRAAADLGLLTPLRRPLRSLTKRLSPSEFVVLSLDSRGWTSETFHEHLNSKSSNVNTLRQHYRTKMGRSESSAEAIRYALGLGNLAFDRVLVAPSPDGSSQR